MGDRRGRWGSARARRVRARVGLVAALVIVASACELTIVANVNDLRVATGRPALPTSAVSTDAARAHSAAMCAAGPTAPSASPGETYDQETAASVRELVGSAPLDPTITDGAARNAKATQEVWDSWKSDPTLTDVRWDDLGVGEQGCPARQRLYLTAVLRESPSMPATGLYSTAVHETTQVQRVNGLQYGSAVNVHGVNQALLLDIYLPPGATPAARPAILLFHGGGFVGGTRANMNSEAVSFAQRGFVAVTVSYRLSTSVLISQPGGLLAAAGNGIDDGMEAVRWLKANAATYRIDPAKIGTLGSSAGGAITLGMALVDDPTPGGPLGAFSPSVAGSISTGAYLTPAIGTPLISFEPTDAPVMMLHYEHDTTTGMSDEYAFETCAAARAGGSTCDFVVNPGNGHTAWVQPGGTWWGPELGPFLWHHLGLGT